MQILFQRSIVCLRTLARLTAALWCTTFILSAQPLESTGIPSRLPSSRVVAVHDARATATYVPDAGIVSQMVERGLSQLWQTPTASEGWQRLVSSSDVVGIRIHSSTGKTSGSRPAVVSAIVKSLIASGHPASQIILWDRQLSSLRAAGYVALAKQLGILAVGARDVGYDGETFYESSIIGTMIWGDHEFGEKGEGKGKRSFVSKLLTQRITKIINLTPLLNHNHASVHGSLVGLALASVDNTLRFQGDRDRLAIAVPEINALPELGDRVILNIVDALIAQYQGETQGRLQDSVVLNELRFGADPVATDIMSIAELERLRSIKGVTAPPPNQTLYDNANLLLLGRSDSAEIQFEMIR